MSRDLTLYCVTAALQGFKSTSIEVTASMVTRTRSVYFDILKKHGFFTVAIAEYEQRIHISHPPLRYVTIVPLIILYELYYLKEEKVVAYPTRSGNWVLLNIPGFHPIRKLPSLFSIPGIRHGSRDHQRVLEQIYTCDNFVGIEEKDTVVDVGAYVGGFTTFASENADHVVAIEPNEAIDDILSFNTRNKENVVIVPKAAWKCKTSVELNTSFRAYENSILSPDKHDKNEVFEVEADTVPNIAREVGVDQVDYLKVEAEGAEPEVLQGVLTDPMKVRKIAVDASPEREGQDAIEEVSSMLESHGYSVEVKDDELWWGDYIVFAISDTE